MTPEHREIRESLGSWAMGHLDPDEQATVDRHLDSCADCRAEAESLRRTTSVLELVDPAIVDSLAEPLPEPPPELEDRVLAGMRDSRPSRSPWRRWVALPVAGALAALILVLVLALNGGGSDPTGPGQPFAFTGLPTGVTIAGNLEPKATGTGIEIDVDGMRPGTLCRVYVRTSRGRLEPAGTFRYRYSAEENESYPATLSTAWDLSEIQALVIKAGDRRFETEL